MLTVSPVRTHRDRRAFLRFPWRVYRDFPQWVPPTLSHQRREIDPRRGPFFTDGFGSTAEFFLARRDGEIVGRIAAIRNERHLTRHQDGVGFFGFFESLDDPGVAHALLAEAERWLRERGLTVARGPTSFTLNDAAGITILGTNVRPSLLSGYTPPHYADLLTSAGYRKARDLLTYHLTFDALERALFQYEGTFADVKRSAVAIRQLDRSCLEREAELLARVFSASWDDNWGAFPILPADLVRAARELGPYFDERLGYVVTVFGEPAAIFLAVPDPAEVLHKLNGRLGPLGALRLLAGRHRVTRCRVLLLGSLPEFRQHPINPLMLRTIQERRRDFPALQTIELAWILEDNRITRDLAEAFGAKHCRTQRIYDKFLD